MDLALGAKQTFVMMNLLDPGRTRQARARVHLPAHRRGVRHPGLHRPRRVPHRARRRRRAGPVRHRLRPSCTDLVDVPLVDGTDATGSHDPHVTRTTVGIVGGGPAGLMLSHLLHVSGIDSVVVDNRTRHEIEHTVRAGILEARQRPAARRHRRLGPGAARRARARRHRPALRRRQPPRRLQGTGRRVGLALPADRRVHRPRGRAGPRRRRRPVRRHATPASPTSTATGPGSSSPTPTGPRRKCVATSLSAPTGRGRICRFEVPEAQRRHYFREYPFAWFGILAEAPKSAPELIYTHSDARLRSDQPAHRDPAADVLPVRPDEDVDDWSEDRIWAELQARVAGADGFTLHEGPDHREDRAAVPQLRRRADAPRQPAARRRRRAHRSAHRRQGSQPRAGRRARARRGARARGSPRTTATRSTSYSPRALDRVWRAQHFSTG